MIVTAPLIVKQLVRTRDALSEGRACLQSGGPFAALAAFKKFHSAALGNDPLLRAVRGEQINPLALNPKPGVPLFDTWIDSNLEVVKAARNIPRRFEDRVGKYCTAEQESGIYVGTIKAQTGDSYLQLRSDDTLVVHWKGSFEKPLEIGVAYNITYKQGKASNREVQGKEAERTAVER